MRIKTSELTGAALDWAVAKCEGYTDLRPNPHAFDRALIMTPPHKEYGPAYLHYLDYSSEWALGGPIIEREKLSIEIKHHGYWMASRQYNYADEKEFLALGDTPLVAAMRCYVASKLGDGVDVPEELT